MYSPTFASASGFERTQTVDYEKRIVDKASSDDDMLQPASEVDTDCKAAQNNETQLELRDEDSSSYEYSDISPTPPFLTWKMEEEIRQKLWVDTREETDRVWVKRLERENRVWMDRLAEEHQLSNWRAQEDHNRKLALRKMEAELVAGCILLAMVLAFVLCKLIAHI
ncbi:hypothetical protein QBC38DRAFT_458194 [Podospora fimiseda]|uniref:Uncharacterized protein n=1 Tax=Podospora fimiseda TaxID=252190 RepID=A0AAN7GTH4_9PEZI|nr:hypothetical protein QBC38DRAFT_458194 [Podospora fimiseda]